MSHPTYKPPLCVVQRLRLQKGGVFAGHYSKRPPVVQQEKNSVVLYTPLYHTVFS